ncbi:uncharacterized protein PODANS_1_9060, partial [Podospora anserina S mat+]
MYFFPTPREEDEGQRSMSFNSLPYLPCQACHPWSVHLPSTAADPTGSGILLLCWGAGGGGLSLDRGSIFNCKFMISPPPPRYWTDFV